MLQIPIKGFKLGPPLNQSLQACDILFMDFQMHSFSPNLQMLFKIDNI